jgi:thioester reductase-like protein
LDVEHTTDGVFFTGATGFVGMELLARYLERTDRRIFALVRAVDDRDAETRVQRGLNALFGPRHDYAGRVVAVRGDVTHPGLGIRGGFDWLAQQVSEIVHAAASVSFEMELQDARSINVDGTRRVFEFAEFCHARRTLRRISFVSTAYVAGEFSGCFSEDDLDVGQRFRNTYEQSKFEAECLIARSYSRLPVTIFRPSIVVGERDSGWTASFNVLYWPLRAFSRGDYSVLPARGNAPVDVVPVDFVADAIFALAQAAEAEGATFHLTAGEHASSVGELVEMAATFFKRSAPRMIDPSLFRHLAYPVLVRTVGDERERRALVRSQIFFPYFAMRVRFDDRGTRIALRGAGIEPAPLSSYFQRLLHFALAAEWGRKTISRAIANGIGAPPPVVRATNPQSELIRLAHVE